MVDAGAARRGVVSQRQLENLCMCLFAIFNAWMLYRPFFRSMNGSSPTPNAAFPLPAAAAARAFLFPLKDVDLNHEYLPAIVKFVNSSGNYGKRFPLMDVHFQF